jgi:hypothetical protein
MATFIEDLKVELGLKIELRKLIELLRIKYETIRLAISNENRNRNIYPA